MRKLNNTEIEREFGINTHKNLLLWRVLDMFYPYSKFLMERLYWHP